MSGLLISQVIKWGCVAGLIWFMLDVILWLEAADRGLGAVGAWISVLIAGLIATSIGLLTARDLIIGRRAGQRELNQTGRRESS